MTGGRFDDGVPLRTVKEIVLKEVSAVRFPAYLSSSIEARGIQELKQLEHRGINSVSEVVNIVKEGNELELRDVETKELFSELERRAKLPANEVIVKPAKRDDEPDDSGDGKQAEPDTTQTTALAPAQQIDVDELSKQIVASVLAGIQTALAQRDGEGDVPEPDGSDMATDDDTQTDSMKSGNCAKSGEKRDDESGESDDGSNDETEADSKAGKKDSNTSKKDSKSAEKRSMEARELLKQINDLEV
jgi:Caudovirus prohead protease.